MNTFSLIFLSVLGLGTGFQLWLGRRQIAHVRDHQQTVPLAFTEKISLPDHQKAAAYTLAKTRFGQILLVVEAGLLLWWTLGGLLDFLDQGWRSLEWSPLWTGVAVIISVMITSTLLDLPANLYNTFQIEAQFSFNRTTLNLFLMDLLKYFILLIMIGVPLIVAVLWLMANAGAFWWLSVWLLWMSFNLLMIWAYPLVIAPLFNEFKPLENEELKRRIEALLQRNGLVSHGIFVMDGSKRSGHGNAYFTGLGTHKRIVFFDTLLEGLNHEEVEAVLAHEVGHFKHKHIQKRIFWMAMISLLGLTLLGWLTQQGWFYAGLGVSHPSHYMALLLFVLTVPVFTLFLSPVMAWLSRKHEFEADNFAAQQANPHSLIQALVKLYQENANTLTPDPLYSGFYDSHPPAPVRVAHLLTKR